MARSWACSFEKPRCARTCSVIWTSIRSSGCKRGGRVLRHQRHLFAPDLTQLAALQPEQFPSLEADAPRRPGPDGEQAEQRQRREGFPRTALPGDPQDLALADRERDAVDGPADPAGSAQRHGEVVDLEQRRSLLPAQPAIVGTHLRIIRAVRGSSMSRSASPRKLNASTTVRWRARGTGRSTNC